MTLVLAALGVVAFVAITVFEQLPVIGWLGGVVSFAVWVVLTRGMLGPSERPPYAQGGAIAWAGVFGAITGFVGALSAWLAQTGNLFGFTTQPGDRFGAAFGFVGASFGLLYWPLVGALVCAITALASAPRR